MDASKILYQSNLPDGTVIKTRKLALLSASSRKELIKFSEDTEEIRICAAIEIQRVFRGYCTRCKILYILDPFVSKAAIYGESKHHLSRIREAFPDDVLDEKLKISSRISGKYHRLYEYYQAYVERMINAGNSQDSPDIQSFEEFCSNYVQDWWQQQKNKRSDRRSQVLSSDKITPKTSGPLSEPEAATVIQKAWRRHIDIQVYRYYRDLINFKQKGDPSLMLRCINPKEANYLDAAMGVHVKFRLAGEKFPPNIYYKIFTHRPIQDLCANSPKDYTKAYTKKQMPKELHNNLKQTKGKINSNEGWYERRENNGWRLVSDRLIHHLLSDPVTWQSSNKRIQFPHNRLQRKQEVARKKKEKKIDWMKKMYKDGMLRAKVEDKETINLIEGAAAGMVATVDTHGPDAVQDWEVDELLDWTTGLNFDDYLNGWKELATSSASEKPVDSRLQLNVPDNDPFEFSISQHHQRKKSGSTRQSRNTPVTNSSAISVNY